MVKCDMNVTSVRRRLLLLVLGLSSPMYSAAETAESEIPVSVDISGWVCKYCEFEQGYSGEIELGAGYISDDSFKFGEYNGLEQDGFYLIGNATVRYRDENAGYLDLRVRDIGLDSREVNIEGGRQGRYRLFLNYDEITHNISDSAMTPYLGKGTEILTLPPGWVAAPTTAGMTALATSLQNVDLETKRKRASVGAAFISASKWETTVNVRHEEREGRKRTAGDFFQSTQLVEPVDYVTDEVEVAVTYTTPKWQSRLAYYGSFFKNHNESLTWEKAYSGFPPVANGRLALPPDNQFHQVLLSSGYQLGERTRVSGDIALGRMEQDEDLLPATISPGSPALPRNSAKAKIDTLTANLKVDSAVNRKLRLKAAFRFNERDNKTPRDVFPTMLADSLGPTDRITHPYSFKDITAKLGADYRINRRARLSGGYDYENKKRTHLEVDKTTEDTFWGKLSVRAGESIDIAVRAAHADRDASKYTPVAETVPPQNPLLRKFNMADRDRDTASIHAGFIPHERVSIALSADYSKDDYSDSVLGLTESREIDYNADASVLLTDMTSVHAYAGRQRIKSEQAGSAAFATPDWYAKNDDTFDTFGIGVKHQLIKDKLDVGADYVLSRSTGEVKVAGTDFPDLKTDLDMVKLYADYRLKDNLTLHAAYRYEHYDSKDWMLDGVDPGTIPTVISFGTDSPEYDVHAVMMSLRYRY